MSPISVLTSMFAADPIALAPVSQMPRSSMDTTLFQAGVVVAAPAFSRSPDSRRDAEARRRARTVGAIRTDGLSPLRKSLVLYAMK